MNTGNFLDRDRISKSVFIALWTTMMDQHRSEYFAIPSEAFHPAFFSVANRLGCRSSATAMASYFGCVVVAERAIVDR